MTYRKNTVMWTIIISRLVNCVSINVNMMPDRGYYVIKSAQVNMCHISSWWDQEGFNTGFEGLVGCGPGRLWGKELPTQDLQGTEWGRDEHCVGKRMPRWNIPDQDLLLAHRWSRGEHTGRTCPAPRTAAFLMADPGPSITISCSHPQYWDVIL